MSRRRPGDHLTEAAVGASREERAGLVNGQGPVGLASVRVPSVSSYAIVKA